MIYESGPWRRDLLRDADVLERWLAKPLSEARSVMIEKKVFIGAYAMRRLIESGKLSSSIENTNVSVDRFPSVKPIGKYDRWDITPFFDFTAGKPITLTIPKLLNLIIHSFIFQEWYDEVAGETNVALTSDIMRDKFLWRLRLSQFVVLMRKVANDDPAVHARRFDADLGEWLEWRGQGNPPWQRDS